MLGVKLSLSCYITPASKLNLSALSQVFRSHLANTGIDPVSREMELPIARQEICLVPSKAEELLNPAEISLGSQNEAKSGPKPLCARLK